MKEKELQNLHRQSKDNNQLVVSFLVMCMLFERAPNADLEFSLRIEFQKAVIEWFHGDLIKFLDWLNMRTPALSQVVGLVCDVSFLERLYFLIDSFEKVLNVRAEVCEWIGKNMDAPDFIRQAERLRVDNKVRKIKQHLDDTRIYIDEVRFKLWSEEKLQSYIRVITASGISGEARDLPNIDASKQGPNLLTQDNVTGSTYSVFALCQFAFSEFCGNPVYGIASYLSRRIPSMGLVASAVTTSKAIEVFSPRVIAMSGICAGIRENCEMGQLIIAGSSWDYQSGKWYNDRFELEPYPVDIDESTRVALSSFSKKNGLLSDLEKDMNCLRPNKQSTPKIAPIASGSSVLAHAEKTEEVAKQHRKVAGIDMEVYGLYRAARLSGNADLRFFAAKTVVDHGDEVKNDELQEYGSVISARFIASTIPLFV